MFMPKFKYVYKCCAVIAMSIILNVFLGWAVIYTLSPLLTAFGKFGTMLMLSIETIGVAVCVVSLLIGAFGGKWIGGHPITGFILSGIFYMGWIFPFAIRSHRPNFDFLTFLIFLGLPIVIITGGTIYTKICKSAINHNNS